eukprot:UN28969
MTVRGLNWAGNALYFQSATLIIDYLTYFLLIFTLNFIYVLFPGGPKNLTAVVLQLTTIGGLMGLKEQMYFQMFGDYVSPSKRVGLTNLDLYYMVKINGCLVLYVWTMARMDMLYWETPRFDLEYVVKTYNWVYLVLIAKDICLRPV